MLSAMRSFSKSKAAWLVFGVLIVAFGIGVGVSDPFSGVSGGGFVRSGDRSIGEADVNRVVNNRIRQEGQESGEYISTRDAAEQGITSEVISELRQRLAILAYADDMGVKASPTAVTSIIAEAPLFKDSLGRFDLAAVERFYSGEGFFNLQAFEEDYRDSLTHDYMVMAALRGLRAPDILIQPVVDFNGERRSFAFARLTPASVSPPEPPTDEQLAAFYEERQDMFEIPELRRFTVLAYSAEDFIDKVELTDDMIASEYQRRIREFSTAETREIVEFSSADRNAVQTVIDTIKQGQSPEDAAAAQQAVTLASRVVQPDDIEDEQYNELVFSVPADDAFGPFELEDEWRGLYVRSITPGIATPLEEVQEDLRMEMARQDGARRFDETYELFFDLIGGGASMEDIAAEVGAPLIELAPVDSRGISLTGGRSTLLQKYPDAVRAMFSLNVGERSDIIETEGERMLIRLDEIIPPRTTPLADVEDELTPLYMAVRSQEAAAAVAERMVATVEAGQSFDAAANAAEMAVLRPPLMSRAAPASLDPTVLQGAFDMSLNQTAVVPDSRGEPWVVQVQSIEPVDPDMASQIAEQARGQLLDSLGGDVGQIFLRDVLATVRIRDNEGAINRYLERLTRTDQ